MHASLRVELCGGFWWWLAPQLGHAEGTATSERSRQQTSPGPLAWGFVVERVTGIEPAL